MFDVVVVGAGPVGLFLGCLLAQRGLGVRVLERRAAPSEHSRAIGIHPPALSALEVIGLTPALIAAGVPIRRGVVRGPARVLGELSFAPVSARYPFVLSLPQHETEVLLEARLNELAPGSLRRGVGAMNVEDLGQGVRLCTDAGEVLQARFVVGADGRQSFVRERAGIHFRGAPYPDTYLMGDFPDTTAYGPDAVIHLAPGGVVESFPLPGGLRRWVARTDGLQTAAKPDELCQTLEARTGFWVPAADCRMLSAFSVRRHLASQMVRGRLIVIGDAAHEVSPIGGQGMNLGWLDSLALAPLLEQAVGRGQPEQAAFQHFERSRRRWASAAARLAEVNMWLGRPFPARRRLHEALIGALLTSPLRPALARTYSMSWG